MKNRMISISLAVALILSVSLVGCGGEEIPGTTEYDLTISSTDGGSVTAPGAGTFTYEEGEVVDLVAEADEGCRFVNWTGDVDDIADVEDATTIITMNDSCTIIASFERLPEDIPGETPPVAYDLTIDSTEGGEVTVPGEGTFTFDEGTVIDIVAEPDEGYQFVSWTRDVGTITDVEAAATTIAMNGGYSITANFQEIPVVYYTLTMAASGSGSTSPAVGQHSYAEGTVVSITATAAGGWQFFNWTGSVGTIASVSSASTTITMNGNYSITANFVVIPPAQYTLAISSTAGGSVTTPGGGTFTYNAGTVVNLVATPAGCHVFVRWSGNVGAIGSVNAASTTITMNGNYQITASFAEEQTVTFPDPNLEAAIRAAISRPTGPICPSALEGLTFFSACHAGIADLAGLEYCTHLTSLNLYGNQISDISPLTNLINLTHLVLIYNQIADLSALANLTMLTDLELAGNAISDISPLANLTNLTRVNLGVNQISDVMPLTNLTKLQFLFLYSNQISDLSPLANLTNLTVFYSQYNQLTDISPLANLTKLTDLVLGGNQISDISPLAGLTRLAELQLDSNQISDISPLANLPNLVNLVLVDNQVSDISPLVQNGGLDTGDWVHLQNNPLSPDSINIYIPQLEARGVTVYY